ncbi:MAG: NAD(P)-dependent oxidoreductase [Candidatus Dormiibacterota bacterium]
MRVALLGTGKMGTAIARQVAGAGHQLTLWNRTRARAEAVGVGAVAGTPAEAVAGAEVVLSILFDAGAVREVYASLEPASQQVFVEMSTAGPEVLEELAPPLEGAGASLLACPIVGSIPAIESAEALLLIGGDAAALERVRSVLETYGRPQLVGPRGDAAGMKLLSNALLGVCSAIGAELLAAGERSGLDREQVFALLCRMVPYLKARERGYLGRDHSNPLFEVRALRKDLDLALQAGHQAAASMPVTAATREMFGLASLQHANEELTAIVEVYEG